MTSKFAAAQRFVEPDRAGRFTTRQDIVPFIAREMKKERERERKNRF